MQALWPTFASSPIPLTFHVVAPILISEHDVLHRARGARYPNHYVDLPNSHRGKIPMQSFAGNIFRDIRLRLGTV